MSNPYAFLGLPAMANQAAGTSAQSYNLAALGGLTNFPALLQQSNANGQPLSGLPFAVQPGLGLGMLPGAGQTVPVGMAPVQIDLTNTDAEQARRARNQRKSQERDSLDRKRRRNDTSGNSDDDVMVLSNSPGTTEERESSSHANKGNESGNKNFWAGSSMMGLVPNGPLGFPIQNAGLLGAGIFPTDPSILAAMGSSLNFDFGLMPGMLPGAAAGSQPGKEAVHLKHSALIPPNPLAPPPTTRERPLGCRTVFVGGLPEGTTEDVLREIFERCGEITTIRMSKKNFAHIRFEQESYVDNAIAYSGYRIRLNTSKPEGTSAAASNTGRLHVDFAQARDDQYEFECQQRRLDREQRHRQRIEEEKWRPPSPPPVPHYADHEAHGVMEQLKSEERFGRAVQVLATWLERGDCSKRNSNAFYSMIQSAHAHLRRLGTEKSSLEEEAKRTYDILKQKFQHLTTQMGEMERLFQAASHQKAWDHFTKAQRKNLEAWKRHVMDIKSAPKVDFLMNTSSKSDDNMDLSDSESDEPRRARSEDCSERNVANLKEENDSLRCQLEAYKNEVEIIKSDMKSELSLKDQQLKIMQENLKFLEGRINQQAKEDSGNSTSSEPSMALAGTSSKIISLVSVFLLVHPKGASVDEITQYVSKVGQREVTKENLEQVLRANPELFREDKDLWLFAPFSSVSLN